MEKLKNWVAKNINKTILAYIVLISKYNRKHKNIRKTLIFAIKVLKEFYVPSKRLSKGSQARKLLKHIKIEINPQERFVYNIDIFKTMPRNHTMIENISIDYARVVHSSLQEMKQKNENLPDSNYKTSQKELLLGIEEYLDRECEQISKSNKKEKEKTIQYLQNIKDKKAVSFEEAIQRILFFNQLLWQFGHTLNGLGRLDKILEESYYHDRNNQKITRQEAKDMLKDMAKILHEKYWFKSNVLMGDTGQIIVLGGKELDGSYFCNELTYLWIEVMEELQLPDPKVLLRVTKEVPRDLIELSLRCIKTGIGCPLFSNDDVVIEKLIAFGYEKQDAYNYVTSACWEPLIASKSIDQNNIDAMVYLEPLTALLETEELEQIDTFPKLMEKYKQYLASYAINFVKEINQIIWEEAPLLSLLTDDCDQKLTDIALGGAKYNHYGVTTVSLGNTVNSLYNIKKFVFEEKQYTLEELNKLRKNNFEEALEILTKLKQQPNRYGTDNQEIIDLSNEIAGYLDEVLAKQTNRLGGKIKFGFSSPTYIIKSEGVAASLDGRKDKEPFGVHISSDKPGLAYTELIQFASQLKYDNHRFNGNVVDFMITPFFIENNFDKMVDFLIVSITLGFFQMQMNVTSSEILIKAKQNPKAYENLIVRVWGFSAYFNDLPEAYKDLLIERALKNEGKNYEHTKI